MKLKNTIVQLTLILAFFLGSCKVSFAPIYNPIAVVQVEQAEKATDDFYDGLISSPNKTYTAHADEYGAIHARIYDILVFDSSRAKIGLVLTIANDIKKRFSSYEEEHKIAGSATTTELITYKNYMHASWESLRNAETNLKPQN